MLRERGAAAVTTRAVADGAGVQAPTIYRLFGDKDGLLEAVAEHAMATFSAMKADAVRAARDEATDPVEDLRTGWSMTIGFGLANPDLFVLLSDPERGRRSAAARAGTALLAERIRRVAEAGRLAVPERRAVEPCTRPVPVRCSRSWPLRRTSGTRHSPMTSWRPCSGGSSCRAGRRRTTAARPRVVRAGGVTP